MNDTNTPPAPAPVELTSEPLPYYESPTLKRLPSNRRPARSTICERCLASVWFASANETKCYCRVMHLVTWSTAEPNTLTACDGQVMAEEAARGG